VVALAVIGVLAIGLGYLALAGESEMSVPDGAVAGDLIIEPCSYGTEGGNLEADCGTLVVPENGNDLDSRLIALPVTRILATGPASGDPVFHLEGGPGISNMSFREASRLTDGHDVVLVGYRGVEGSSVLRCPEVVSALKASADFGGRESQRSFSDAFADCHQRLTDDGVDLDGYSLPQRVDDLEAVRVALGYDRINLLSQSVGTRTAMIYSWRYPEALNRSVMVAVNPPGHFIWDGQTTDDQLGRYTQLCSTDDDCSRRTTDLATTMRRVSDDMPDRLGFLPIKEGNVRVATMYGLFETNEEVAPLNAPAMLDTWIRSADDDASGLWFLSLMADLAFPDSFVWGEYAATGMMDAPTVDAYYRSGGDRGSILRNTATDFNTGGGDLTGAWPASPDYESYREVQTSDVETLLIGGDIDFSTPPNLATDELLPSLTNGDQVILAGFGHSGDFYEYQADAGERLLTSFFDNGEVDTSLYVDQAVDFEPGAPTPAVLGKIVAGLLIGLALVAVLLLAWMAGHVYRKAGFGPRAGAWLRSTTPLILGLGGWFLALLIVMTTWPAVAFDNQIVAVAPMGTAIGLGAYLAWTDRYLEAEAQWRGFTAALGGALIGAWIGFNVTAGLVAVATTIAGAAIAANLALIVLDIRSTTDDETQDRPQIKPTDDKALTIELEGAVR
jgi:pimeloyl-ACP methyl ester carboxylesterase